MLTFHAVQRFRERVRPNLGLNAARRELGRLLAGAEISLTVPDWARGRILTSHHPDEWLGLEDEMLVFPVEHGRVLTCYAQQHVGAQIRIVRR